MRSGPLVSSIGLGRPPGLGWGVGVGWNPSFGLGSASDRQGSCPLARGSAPPRGVGRPPGSVTPGPLQRPSFPGTCASLTPTCGRLAPPAATCGPLWPPDARQRLSPTFCCHARAMGQSQAPTPSDGPAAADPRVPPTWDTAWRPLDRRPDPYIRGREVRERGSPPQTQTCSYCSLVARPTTTTEQGISDAKKASLIPKKRR
jgi:hypothetical protein